MPELPKAGRCGNCGAVASDRWTPAGNGVKQIWCGNCSRYWNKNNIVRPQRFEDILRQADKVKEEEVGEVVPWPKEPTPDEREACADIVLVPKTVNDVLLQDEPFRQRLQQVEHTVSQLSDESSGNVYIIQSQAFSRSVLSFLCATAYVGSTGEKRSDRRLTEHRNGIAGDAILTDRHRQMYTYFQRDILGQGRGVYLLKYTSNVHVSVKAAKYLEALLISFLRRIIGTDLNRKSGDVNSLPAQLKEWFTRVEPVEIQECGAAVYRQIVQQIDERTPLDVRSQIGSQVGEPELVVRWRNLKDYNYSYSSMLKNAPVFLEEGGNFFPVNNTAIVQRAMSTAGIIVHQSSTSATTLPSKSNISSPPPPPLPPPPPPPPRHQPENLRQLQAKVASLELEINYYREKYEQQLIMTGKLLLENEHLQKKLKNCGQQQNSQSSPRLSEQQPPPRHQQQTKGEKRSIDHLDDLLDAMLNDGTDADLSEL